MHLTPSSLTTGLLSLATLTIQEIMVDKVPGFTHSSHTDLGTDYLTSTFCYCAAPTHNESIKDEAHFFLIEYYNFNLNTTFILPHLCTACQDDVFTCLSPRTEDGNLGRDDLFGWSGRVCKTWPRCDKYGVWVKHEDELCYMPHKKHVKGAWEDFSTFNHQERDVGERGKQGLLEKSPEEAREACEPLCLLETGLLLLEDNDLGVSNVVVYDHLDDMCDGCP